ncbi:hypothetical protein [Natrinema sp. SYSU A 869]|uniref:hypothetical protein n=1 Tax=Natrinema sp. SYSU A 869 TaxID=2871694 RepID=UPI001CA3CFD8|nr:hypothetical protein [Natrinema sp. SYSU A 869]
MNGTGRQGRSSVQAVIYASGARSGKLNRESSGRNRRVSVRFSGGPTSGTNQSLGSGYRRFHRQTAFCLEKREHVFFFAVDVGHNA